MSPNPSPNYMKNLKLFIEIIGKQEKEKNDEKLQIADSDETNKEMMSGR